MTIARFMTFNTKACIAMHVNTMNVYLITATTYEGGAPEGERFALFAAGRTMREAFETFARVWARPRGERWAFDNEQQAIDTAMASFDLSIAPGEIDDGRSDTNFFVDDDGGACTFDIVRVASEGERCEANKRAIADSLARAFDHMRAYL